MQTLLNAKCVTKIYNKNQRPGLDKVSLEVFAGEFISIMDPSGSGFQFSNGAFKNT